MFLQDEPLHGPSPVAAATATSLNGDRERSKGKDVSEKQASSSWLDKVKRMNPVLSGRDREHGHHSKDDNNDDDDAYGDNDDGNPSGASRLLQVWRCRSPLCV